MFRKTKNFLLIGICFLLMGCGIGGNSEDVHCENPVDLMEVCNIYFDGCNTCIVENGEIKECTTKTCSTNKNSYCRKYTDWYDQSNLCLD